MINETNQMLIDASMIVNKHEREFTIQEYVRNTAPSKILGDIGYERFETIAFPHEAFISATVYLTEEQLGKLWKCIALFVEHTITGIPKIDKLYIEHINPIIGREGAMRYIFNQIVAIYERDVQNHITNTLRSKVGVMIRENKKQEQTEAKADSPRTSTVPENKYRNRDPKFGMQRSNTYFEYDDPENIKTSIK